MIPGPIVMSDCFLTDQRGFSNHIHAKSRLHSEFNIAPGSWPTRLSQLHYCDPKTEVDCEDGDVEGTETGDTSRMGFALLPSRVCSPSGPFEVELKCAACNPLAPTSRLFGDIDYHGRVTVAPASRTIEIDLWIDAFPAFEAYATINDGAGVTVFQEPPPAGNTVMNLPASANRRVRRRLEDRNGDGIFETLTRL
jgi:hypothetical protein